MQEKNDNKSCLYSTIYDFFTCFFRQVELRRKLPEKRNKNGDSVHTIKVKFIPSKILQIGINYYGASHSIVQS